MLTDFFEPEPTPQTQPARSLPAATDYSYEDFEDEPDEILSDFLEPEPGSTPQPKQNTVQRAIAPASDKAAASSADGWLTLKEVAETFKQAGVQKKRSGTNYSTLSSKRGQMNDEEFLDYLYQKTLEARRPQRWEFDRSLGQKGMFRPIAPPSTE